MREVGKLELDDKGRMFFCIEGDRILMSNNLLFYLIAEFKKYENEEKNKEFKKGFSDMVKILVEAKGQNNLLRQGLD